MKLKQAISQLDSQATCIQALLKDLTTDEGRWAPDPESWSIQIVLAHLVYEEQWDFRWMLDQMVFHPNNPWPKRPKYEHSLENETLESLMAHFMAARDNSLSWLGDLPDGIDWQQKVKMPWGDLMPMGDMLTSWVAHDLLHLRQLVALRFALTVKASQPFDVAYAGPWEQSNR